MFLETMLEFDARKRNNFAFFRLAYVFNRSSRGKIKPILLLDLIWTEPIPLLRGSEKILTLITHFVGIKVSI